MLKQITVSILTLLTLAAAAGAAVPASNHVVVIVEENHSYKSVVGNSAMPYFNSLAKNYVLLNNYYANTHPSIGNYLAMTTGQVITNNDGYSGTITQDNLVRHMLLAGKTWKSYAESLPSAGYIGGDAYPYCKHHNPFAYFTDVRNSSVQRMQLVPFSNFAADVANGTLPDFSFIAPNMDHNAHDGTLAQADYWLKKNIQPLLSSAEFQKDGILIIVFDESASTDTAHGGGHIAVLVVGPKTKKGYRAGTFYQHQSLLKTVMNALGMSSAPSGAAGAKAFDDAFQGN